MPIKIKESRPPTLAQIAQDLAISTRRVSQLKDLGMPVASLEAARAWRTTKDGDDSAVTLRRERIRLLRAQTGKAELELKNRRGEFVSRVQCAEDQSKIAAALGVMLRAIETEIPALCFEKALGESKAAVKEKIRTLQQGVADQLRQTQSLEPLKELGLPAARECRTAKIDSDDSAVTLRRERISLLRAQTGKAELELNIRRGGFVSRVQCAEDQSKIAQALSGMLRAMETEIPALSYGKSLGGTRLVLKKQIRNFQMAFDEAEKEFWKERPLEEK